MLATLKELNCLGYNFKNSDELNTFLGFVNFLKNDNEELTLHSCTDYFFFGYQIPQLGKEMDLIRFGKNYNLNIEYKSESTKEKMVEQLKKNYFYLHFLDVPTRYFSFSLKNNLFIEFFPEDGTVVDCSAEDLLNAFEKQDIEVITLEQANTKFEIKNYLVSPFNDVEKFIKSEYLLTPPQYNFKDEILKSSSLFSSVNGRPGTGKSLLLYDLCKELIDKGKSVYVLHCAKLNQGQERLKAYGYKILAIKDYKKIDFENADFILIDESQRIHPRQRDEIIETSKLYKVRLIFFMDGQQTLHDSEEKAKNEKIITDLVKSTGGKCFKLRDKYRSNPDLANFIKLFFKFPIDQKKIERVSNYNNIVEVKYFDSKNSAENYLKSKDNYQVLSYTCSLYNKNEKLNSLPKIGKISHEVIGQEFDSVTVVLDSNFHYEANLKNDSMILKAEENSYYNSKKMLYQNLTRARKKVELVIIGSQNILYNLSKIIDF
ncbi:DNA/RNA helicase domain-containing protein [Streptococcus gallolyticus]|uniref:DNA/RNA helicase domain-containing protein n=1 Tax=Streptococcus gallolyticus TaxID=315405 RepID=UPI00088086B2|nr:DNA/RNA helicase domain-containing protein [Streptococcus gallolyticus]SDK10160.1 replication restart DNA helicase PriA [Streptococcus gallolyticus]SDL59423.1 replication restart DNA helicase PriA [Streptococcus gallolyticus]